MLYFALDLSTTCNRNSEFRNSLGFQRVGTDAARIVQGFHAIALPRMRQEQDKDEAKISRR
jgi:hypothetical protein